MYIEMKRKICAHTHTEYLNRLHQHKMSSGSRRMKSCLIFSFYSCKKTFSLSFIKSILFQSRHRFYKYDQFFCNIPHNYITQQVKTNLQLDNQHIYHLLPMKTCSSLQTILFICFKHYSIIPTSSLAYATHEMCYIIVLYIGFSISFSNKRQKTCPEKEFSISQN